MQVIKALTATSAFLLELFMLFSLAYYGYHSSTNKILNIVLAIGLPLIAIVIWGLFAAPKANYRITQPYRMLFELTLFLISAFLLYKTGKQTWAIAFAIVAIVTEVLAFLLKI